MARKALTRGQKAARTRAANKARREEITSLANRMPPMQAENTGNGTSADRPTFDTVFSMIEALSNRVRGLDTSVRQIVVKVFGDTPMTDPAAPPAKTPAELARDKRIADLQAELSALNGGTASTEPQANGSHVGATEIPMQADAAPAPGSYTPQADLMLPLLATLAEFPEGASTREVLKRIESRISLKPADRDRLSTGAIRWENAVMFQRQKAKAAGFLMTNSPRGHWQLSPNGRAMLVAAQKATIQGK